MSGAGGVVTSGPSVVRKRKLPTIELKTPISEMQGKEYVYTLFSDPRSCKAAYVYMMLQNAAVFVSSWVMVFETLFQGRDSLSYNYLWFMMDTVFASAFTFDLVVRMLSAKSITVFWSDWLNWLDFITTAPYFLQVPLGPMYNTSSGMLRCLRAARHMKMIKVTKFGTVMVELERAMIKSLSALVVPIFYMALALVVLSSLCYFLEMTPDADNTCTEAAQWPNCVAEDCAPVPADAELCKAVTRLDTSSECEAVVKSDGSGEPACAYSEAIPFSSEDEGWNAHDRPPFDDLPVSIWWCLVTMTGTGYGDFYPSGFLGMVTAAFTAKIGVFFIAMPFAVSGGSFWHAWSLYVEQRELERLMKEGDVAETLSPDELGFQKGAMIKLLAQLYKSASPLKGLMEAETEEDALSDGKLDQIVEQINTFADDLVDYLQVMHKDRLRELVIREWARERESNMERRLDEPSYPDMSEYEDQAPVTAKELSKACEESLFPFELRSEDIVANPLGKEDED
jgi:hypothetical protein|eukprot:COSAG02_NODE_1297_length_13389_cov_6.460572_10_plen_510_part_00